MSTERKEMAALAVLTARLGARQALLTVARGAIPTTTPDRFMQANHFVRAQGCKKGGDHRFFLLRSDSRHNRRYPKHIPFRICEHGLPLPVVRLERCLDDGAAEAPYQVRYRIDA